MKRVFLIFLLLLWLLPSGCGTQETKTAEDGAEKSFTHISQEEAKRLMEGEEDVIILDVRRQDEFAEGHIAGAICIPNEEIGEERPAALPELDQIILVYCRSGRRSKEAAQKLADMGYTRVLEFGGIIDWTGDFEI